MSARLSKPCTRSVRGALQSARTLHFQSKLAAASREEHQHVPEAVRRALAGPSLASPVSHIGTTPRCAACTSIGLRPDLWTYLSLRAKPSPISTVMRRIDACRWCFLAASDHPERCAGPAAHLSAHQAGSMSACKPTGSLCSNQDLRHRESPRRPIAPGRRGTSVPSWSENFPGGRPA